MTGEGAAPVLSVEKLSVDFRTSGGRLHALREVTLEVPRAKIVGVVGESGCGKSTLINAILGLLAANGEVVSGRILFDGEDIVRMSEARLRALRGQRISVVFQDPMTALNPVLSVGTQMVDIQYRSGLSRKAKLAHAEEMLAKVQIPDPRRRLAQYPHEFSGGMRQRIAIAMALMAKPDLLIADEPTTALDATLEVQVIELLRELQRDIGCSILFISHHLGVVAELCDRVVVMYAGEVAERGAVRDIFHRAGHPYTGRLLECDPARIEQPTRSLPTIPGDLPDLVELPPGCIFRARCRRAIERCEQERPDERRLGDWHLAACFRAGEGAP
ncbi:MAG: ABC transporter ATP-binding protein [Kiloniellales bacterium]